MIEIYLNNADKQEMVVIREKIENRITFKAI